VRSHKYKQPLFRLKPISQMVILALSSISLASVASTTDPYEVKHISFLQAPARWSPRITFTGENGSYGYGQADLFYPFLKIPTGLMFVDLRAGASSQSAQEYNAALGLRKIIGENSAIIGAHIWDDYRHSQYGNFFSQGTLGLEYFGRIYSVTTNFYVPYGKSKELLNTTTDPFATGNIVGYYQTNDYQEALRGADVEVGKENLVNRHLRIYGAYLHYGIGDDDVRVNGGRVRAEYIIDNQKLNTRDSNLVLLASYQYDNVRHSVGMVGLRINLGRDYHPTDPMVGRLEEYIVRDDDIVMVKTHNTQTVSRVVDTQDNFIYVDNAAPPGGDGTRERPFNTEEEAINASAPGSTIYTFRGGAAYPLPVGGLDLQINQSFFGSGSALTFNNVTIFPAGTPPTLNGRINLADGNTLKGFTVSGASTTENIGIQGDSLSNISITNVTVEDFSVANSDGAAQTTTTGSAAGGVGGVVTTQAQGIRLTNSTDVTLTDITVQNIIGGSANGGDAATTANVSISVTGGTAGTGGDATGINLAGSTNATLDNVTVNNITAGSANGGSGTGSSNSTTNNVRVYGGYAGTGGQATGVDLIGSAGVNLNNITITNIIGGSSNGGGVSLTNTAVSTGNIFGFAGYAGSGGAATGLDLSNASNAIVNGVIISTIAGGSANAGDANSSIVTVARNELYGGQSYVAGETGGGTAIGVNMTNLTSGDLSSISINNINGGSALGGSTSSASGNATVTSRQYGGYGGYSGKATGIEALGSNAALSSITISNISSGLATGGLATANMTGSSNRTGGGAVGARDAIAINLDNSAMTLTNITISNIAGNSAQGGNATGTAGGLRRGGDGGGGGNGIGINLNGATVDTSSVTFSNITGGSGSGGTGAPDGLNAPNGTGTNVVP
jgi:hypothetical protein